MSDIRIQKTGEPDILQASDGRLTLSVRCSIWQLIRRHCGMSSEHGSGFDPFHPTTDDQGPPAGQCCG